MAISYCPTLWPHLSVAPGPDSFRGLIDQSQQCLVDLDSQESCDESWNRAILVWFDIYGKTLVSLVREGPLILFGASESTLSHPFDPCCICSRFLSGPEALCSVHILSLLSVCLRGNAVHYVDRDSVVVYIKVTVPVILNYPTKFAP